MQRRKRIVLTKVVIVICLVMSGTNNQPCKGVSIDSPITLTGDNSGSGGVEFTVSQIGFDISSQFTVSTWVKISAHVPVACILKIGDDVFLINLLEIPLPFPLPTLYSAQVIGPLGLILGGLTHMTVNEWHQIVFSVRKVTGLQTDAALYTYDSKLTLLNSLLYESFAGLGWSLDPTDTFNFGNFVNGEPYTSVDGVISSTTIIPYWMGNSPSDFAIHSYRRPKLHDFWILNFSDHDFVYNNGRTGRTSILTKSKGIPLDFSLYPVEDTTDKVYKFVAPAMITSESTLPSDTLDKSNTKTFFLKIKFINLPSSGSRKFFKFLGVRIFEFRLTSAGRIELWSGSNDMGFFPGVTVSAGTEFKSLSISYSNPRKTGSVLFLSVNLDGVASSMEATGVIQTGSNAADTFDFEIGNTGTNWNGMEFSVAEFSTWTGGFPLLTTCSDCQMSAGFFYVQEKHCLECPATHKRIIEHPGGADFPEVKCLPSIPGTHHQVTTDQTSESYLSTECSENPSYQNIVTPTPATTPPTVCSQCHADCLTCSGPESTDCITCYTAANRYKSGTECPLCPLDNGFFMNYGTGTCNSCSTGCKTCSGSGANQCMSCDLVTNHNFCPGCSGAAGGEGTCIQCPALQFWDGASCQGCDPSCITCNGIGANRCTSCDNASNFYLCDGCSGALAGEGTCLLCDTAIGAGPSGLTNYWSGTACSTCDASCQTCDGPLASDCLSCDLASSFYLEGDGTCNLCDEVNNQVYWSSPTCGNCDPSCDHCSGPSSNDCNSCDQANLYYDNGGTCSLCQSDTNGSNEFWDLANLTCESCSGNCASGKCTGPLDEDCEGWTPPTPPTPPNPEPESNNPEDPPQTEDPPETEDSNPILTWNLRQSGVFGNRIIIEFNKKVELSSEYLEDGRLAELFDLKIQDPQISIIEKEFVHSNSIYFNYKLSNSNEETFLILEITDLQGIYHILKDGTKLYLTESAKEHLIRANIKIDLIQEDQIEVFASATANIGLGAMVVGGALIASSTCINVSLGFLFKMIQTIEFISLLLFFNVDYSDSLYTQLKQIHDIMNLAGFANPLQYITKSEKFGDAGPFKGKLSRVKTEPFFVNGSGIEFLVLFGFWFFRLICSFSYQRKKLKYGVKDEKIKKNKISPGGLQDDSENTGLKAKPSYSILHSEANEKKKEVKNSNNFSERISRFFYIGWTNTMLLFYVDYIFISSVNALYFHNVLNQSVSQIFSSILSVWTLSSYTYELMRMMKEALSYDQVRSHIIYSKPGFTNYCTIEKSLNELYYEGIKPEALKTSKIARAMNMLELIRYKFMVIGIIFFQNFPIVQISLVLSCFFAYVLIIIYQQAQHKIYSSWTNFIFKVTKELGMLGLLSMVFIYANQWIVKIDTLEKINLFETIFLLLFCLTVLIEILSALVATIAMLIEVIKKRKGKDKKNKKVKKLEPSGSKPLFQPISGNRSTGKRISIKGKHAESERKIAKANKLSDLLRSMRRIRSRPKGNPSMIHLKDKMARRKDLREKTNLEMRLQKRRNPLEPSSMEDLNDIIWTKSSGERMMKMKLGN